MRKVLLPLLALVLMLLAGCNSKPADPTAGNPAGDKGDTEAVVLTELPFSLEKYNPVPTVKNWEEDGHSIWYFSWGQKNTGGYTLELMEVTGNVIKIKAVSPVPGQSVTEALTYPWLAVSLPKGDYTYEVHDARGQTLKDFFAVINEPLQFTLYLPHNGGIGERQVLRDPYLNNEGKTTAQIALEALFSQNEMAFAGCSVQGVSFTDTSWVVLMSEGYQNLSSDDKKLLDDLVTQTVSSIKTDQKKSVVMTTDPSDLPPLQN